MYFLETVTFPLKNHWTSNARDYTVLSTHDKDSIIQFMSKLKETSGNVSFYIEGRDKPVKVKDLFKVRFQNLLKDSSTHCVGCKCQLDHFRLERNYLGYHFNAYTSEGQMLTCDHVIPKSEGGEDTLENTQLLCEACNSHKKSMPMEEFMKEVNKVSVKVKSDNTVLRKDIKSNLSAFKNLSILSETDIKKGRVRVNIEVVEILPKYLITRYIKNLKKQLAKLKIYVQDLKVEIH